MSIKINYSNKKATGHSTNLLFFQMINVLKISLKTEVNYVNELLKINDLKNLFIYAKLQKRSY